MNGKYLNSDEIMLPQRMKTMQKKRLAELQRNQEISEMKHEQLQRIASESESTSNSYTEDYETSTDWVETGNYTDIILMKKRDAPNIYQRPKHIFDVGQETDHEFNKRQYGILQQLKQKRKIEDDKYENE